MGRLRTCIKTKTVYSPAYGHNVERCAKFKAHGENLMWRKVILRRQMEVDLKMGKMRIGECRCTVKGMEYCRKAEGVRFTGKCPKQER